MLPSILGAIMNFVFKGDKKDAIEKDASDY